LTGSGKTTTLNAVLRSLSEFDLVTLNFSSTTSSKLLLDTLNHHCKIEKTPLGLIMKPISNKILTIFADEINLPSSDKYGTQHVITLMRQIIEHEGYWRSSDLSFIRLERIQIIGACNPPTDAGRLPLSNRFLRHTPLLHVDYPDTPSLKTIYGTFNRALLKLIPSLRIYWESLTDSMIDVYIQSQNRFTPDQQAHYIYSPRELSRWVRALYEAIQPISSSGLTMSIEELVRLWAHEALRLFQDRLVQVDERQWTDILVDETASKYFPSIDIKTVLARPILFSVWLSRFYKSVSQDELRQHIKGRLKVFYEEEIDVKLVTFDEVIDYILRIDRVLRQSMGHMLIVGTSGAGSELKHHY